MPQPDTDGGELDVDEGVGEVLATIRLTALRVAIAVCGITLPPSAQSGPPPAVEPLTRIESDGSGYLADPQPIHLATSASRQLQYLSGTTKAIISGSPPPQPQAFGWTPITVNADDLQSELSAAGATLTAIQNTNIYQDNVGGWHAAVGLDVVSPSYPGHWTVTAHAHPTVPSGGGAPPNAWMADKVLEGSFAIPVQGNYDAKYYTEAGRLYLLYVRNYVPEPGLRNEIVIQPMLSPTEKLGESTVLLTPGGRYGALKSEQYATTQAKLVEAPYITLINGKHALVYSTGSYLTSGYKTGVAWSDTLIPSKPQARYRKVLMPDAGYVWGDGGKPEVRYLLQSEKPTWPNFTAASVVGPGVAAAVRDAGGDYWLYFNGYAPDDMFSSTHMVEPSRRRPYAVHLKVNVPVERSVSVSHVSDEQLARWMQPVTQ